MVPGKSVFACVAVVCIEVALSMRVDQKQGGDFSDALKHFDGHVQIVADLGYFSWQRNCKWAKPASQRSSIGDVEIEELRCGLGLGADAGPPGAWQLPEAFPARLVDVKDLRSRLPVKFYNASSVGYTAAFPNRPPPVARLVAASKNEDVNMSKIDFFIDGSILYILATGDIDRSKVTVQRHRDMVMMLRSDDFFVPLTKPAFQFKRFCTGLNLFNLRRKTPFTEHLQVLRIGRFNVLIAAEVDSMDEHWRAVQIDTLSKPNWKKILLQMVSSGSEGLLRGVTKGRKLTGIDEYDAWKLVGMLSDQERERLVNNITRSLKTVRNLVGMKKVPFDLSAWSAKGSPTLVPLSEQKRALLPEAAVLEELFPKQGGKRRGRGRKGGGAPALRPASADDGQASESESFDLRAIIHEH